MRSGCAAVLQSCLHSEVTLMSDVLHIAGLYVEVLNLKVLNLASLVERDEQEQNCYSSILYKSLF